MNSQESIDIVLTFVANVTPGTDTNPEQISAALIAALNESVAEIGGYGPVQFTVNHTKVTADSV